MIEKLENKKNKLTKKMIELISYHPNNFIKDLWEITSIAVCYGSIIGHLKCYQYITKKNDLDEYYKEKIMKEEI